ncbi:MAG: iron-sulfur cluster insertion protein ErpA [Pseudomonadota bacterium]|nr:iron-sulfur cluster insertion protein ErpA [Pseudomonadota bacterium]
MNTDTMEKPQVTVTQAALRRVAKILAGETERDALRISVTGGGCSGFSYQFDLVKDDRQDDDLVIEGEGAAVLIDPVSIQYMEGSEVDFVNDLMGQSFQIRNPNAVANCGCGTSFSI